MLHVLFNEPDMALLKEVQDLDPGLEGPIVLVRDDYAVGPIHSLDLTEGQQQRLSWWKSCYDKGSKQIPPRNVGFGWLKTNTMYLGIIG